MKLDQAFDLFHKVGTSCVWLVVMLSLVVSMHYLKQAEENIFFALRYYLWGNLELGRYFWRNLMQEQRNNIWKPLVIAHLRVLIAISSQYTLDLSFVRYHKIRCSYLLEDTCSFYTIFVNRYVKIVIFEISKLLVNSLLSFYNLINLK